MKKIYFILTAACFTATLSNAQQMWENFEDVRRVNYFFENGVFIPYNENPDPSGANTSLVAASYARNSAELFDVIVMDRGMADISDYISGAKVIRMDVWSPVAGKTVQITLENSIQAQPTNYPTGRRSEHFATTTVAGQWETLTFVMSNQPDPNVGNGNVNRLVILFDPNSNNSDTYYWDNLRAPEFSFDQCAGVTTNENILNDFECQQNVNFTFSHSGINFRRIPNPDMTGNSSTHVARYVRNGGEENDVIIGRFDGTLNIAGNNVINLDVWDPNAPTNVLFSLQNNAGDVILEMSAQTIESSGWQTLTFDPSAGSEATDISQFVILFDPGAGTSDEYFFDNLRLDMSFSVADLDAVVSFNAFPNPSQGQTNFEFELRQSVAVIFTVTDVTGKVVDQLHLGQRATGANQFVWNAHDLADGLYFYTFNAGGKASSGKLFLNK